MKIRTTRLDPAQVWHLHFADVRAEAGHHRSPGVRRLKCLMFERSRVATQCKKRQVGSTLVSRADTRIEKERNAIVPDVERIVASRTSALN